LYPFSVPETPRKPALFLVATPIGNLEDITLRALRTLKEVDTIACEDTRQTQKLLSHYGIEKKTISYHEHNELTRSAELIMHLERGESIALVTDAGMPGISDPGYRLVALAIRHHIPVIPIPGPSAFVASLVASGLPTDSFRFNGFVPEKSGKRVKLFESIKESPRTQIFYEAPHRLLETLQDVVDVFGPGRHVVIAREVTKIYEEFVRGHAKDVLLTMQARDEIRGEITLLIGKEEDHGAPVLEQKNVRQRVRALVQSEGIDEKEAMKRVAKEMGVSKSEVYRELQKGK
jgi:16S rRNA (cytidine1402-2'-O)-methyltransferase